MAGCGMGVEVGAVGGQGGYQPLQRMLSDYLPLQRGRSDRLGVRLDSHRESGYLHRGMFRWVRASNPSQIKTQNH
jgi:hypothetical protein